MKLLMIIVDDGKKEELEVLLNRAGVAGCTEIPRATGMGTTGPRLGSRRLPEDLRRPLHGRRRRRLGRSSPT